jgi:hypothetical protein
MIFVLNNYYFKGINVGFPFKEELTGGLVESTLTDRVGPTRESQNNTKPVESDMILLLCVLTLILFVTFKLVLLSVTVTGSLISLHP